MGETKQSREFWATQLIGSEDGNYFMSEDEQTVEKLAMVETKFKVIEHSALVAERAENARLRELLAKANALEDATNQIVQLVDENTTLRAQLAKAVEQRNGLARGRIYNGEATAERYILKLDRELEEVGE